MMEFLVLRMLILKHKTKSLKRKQIISPWWAYILDLKTMVNVLWAKGIGAIFSQEVSTGAASCLQGWELDGISVNKA